MNCMQLFKKLHSEMIEAAEHLEFERAAMLRDKIKELQKKNPYSDTRILSDVFFFQTKYIRLS